MCPVPSSNPATPAHPPPELPGWLFVLPWSLRELGGVDEVVKSLSREFRKGGVFCSRLLITTEQPESNGTPWLGGIETDRLNLWSPVIREHPVRGLLSFLYRLPYRCWVLNQIVKRHSIRVINPHYPDLGSLVFLILKKLRIFKGAIILSFHLSDVNGALASTKIEKKLWKSLLRGADSIVVVSDDLGNAVHTLDPAVAAKVTTIHNGVDLQLFAPSERKSLSDIGIPDQVKMILSIGTFIPRKGHDVLVRAFVHVLAQMPDTHLLLIGGTGSETERIQQMINTLSLEKNITLLKDVPHESIPKFFRRAQLFVLASRQESFGLVVTEAAAAQVPVVCTRAEGIRELIEDGLTGRLVDIDDPIALAEAILQVLKEPAHARKMALEFYERVKGSMTWHHAYVRYLEVATFDAARRGS